MIVTCRLLHNIIYHKISTLFQEALMNKKIPWYKKNNRVLLINN